MFGFKISIYLRNIGERLLEEEKIKKQMFSSKRVKK